MEKKKITISDLTTAVNGLTKNVNTIATAIEDLAGMVKAGFDAVDKRFERVENRLTTLENGQEKIKLRLFNVAYHSEVVELENKIKTLTKQMKTLEWLVLSKIKRKGNEA